MAFNHNIAIIRAFHVSWADRIMVRLVNLGLHADWRAFPSEPMPLLPPPLLRSTEHCAQSNLPAFSCSFYLSAGAVPRRACCQLGRRPLCESPRLPCMLCLLRVPCMLCGALGLLGQYACVASLCFPACTVHRLHPRQPCARQPCYCSPLLLPCCRWFPIPRVLLSPLPSAAGYRCDRGGGRGHR